MKPTNSTLSLDKNQNHDFINNSMRLEIISQMICEQLEEQKKCEKKLLKDLKENLSKQIILINEILNE